MMNRREKNHYPPKVMVLFGLVISVIVGICALNFYYFREVEKSLIKQTYRDLKQENDKAQAYLQIMVRTKFEWLEVFASYCDLPDGSGTEEWWKEMDRFQEEGARFGVADDRGTIYFGDHESEDISERDYYRNVLNGEKSVSAVLAGDFDGQDGIVLAVPIIRDGAGKGAACIEYTTEELGKYINNTELSRYGTNLVFSRNGDLLVSGAGSETYGTVYEMLGSMEFRDGQSLEQMEESVEKGLSGYVTYYSNDNKRLLYFQPAGIGDWMVASLVETEGYESTLHRIRGLSVSFITGSTALLFFMVLLIFCILHLRKKEAERAQKDYLTGVYTRETARKLVEQGLKSVGKKRFYACMFLDIDDFKKINDTFGHHKGDLVLVQVGQILNACTREEDVIVRFGGDEFCIWLYGIRGRKSPEAIAERILNAFHISGKIHASIGITMVGEWETEYDAILKRADEALYRAKRKGKNQFAVQL
ncbi:diguanylate cyclase [Lachnospiraceae bacterium 54-53]